MITGAQIRIARTAVRWTAEELAANSGVGARTIKRIEKANGLPDSTVSTISKLKNTLEAAGIEFIGTPEDGPGIRIHAKPDRDA
ncbi:helix-turn-helix domain-containing protein [Loktanella sp. 5RATIMAR09]|uniref:helix-turn-helix domain-containing protein n=1 Tax=Loktanella sp. 5RATIMAR09 TaxID=1225655 RepID=UPI0006EB4DE0|nr:helix-turn-helix domain-containing protein [Loktanella sp. 5RATIMAR09]